MPKKIQNFARSALVKPVTVNVGRAGAASLDVIQEVEYVKEEAKIVYLLECLQKTPPPVGSENYGNIYVYLHFLSFLSTEKKPCAWRTRARMSSIVNIVAADDLANCVARASAAMLLTYISQNIMASAPKVLIGHGNFFRKYSQFAPQANYVMFY